MTEIGCGPDEMYNTRVRIRHFLEQMRPCKTKSGDGGGSAFHIGGGRGYFDVKVPVDRAAWSVTVQNSSSRILVLMALSKANENDVVFVA